MPITYVFDVMIDTLAPVRARAGEVLVVRGEAVSVVVRGTTHVVRSATVSPSALTALVVRGAVRRRGSDSRRRAG